MSIKRRIRTLEDRQGTGPGGGVIIHADPADGPPPEAPPAPDGMGAPVYCTRAGWIDAAEAAAVLYLPPLTAADTDFSHWDATAPEG